MEKLRDVSQNISIEQGAIGDSAQREPNPHVRLEHLTISEFRAHRQEYATVMETTTEAYGARPFGTKYAQLVPILKNRGIEIFALQRRYGNGRIQTYLIFPIDDKGEAVRILREDPEAKSLMKTQVEQLCGPKVDPLPLASHIVKNRQKYSPVSPFLRSLGLTTGRGSKNSVRNFFDEDSPIPIFRSGVYHVFPAGQEDLLGEYARRKAQGASKSLSPRLRTL